MEKLTAGEYKVQEFELHNDVIIGRKCCSRWRQGVTLQQTTL
jgi:hypothetical protein